MAFGDNGPRKKSFFEILTLFVVIIMAIISIGGIFLTAFSAIMN